MSKIIESEIPGYPRIKITEAAMRTIGMDINVDLDGVNELLREDLGLERSITPHYVLYGRSRSAQLRGAHMPYTRTAYVQIPTSHETDDDYGASTFIHESVHLVDSWQHPIRTSSELALRGLAHTVSLKAARELAATDMGPDALDGFVTGFAYWQLRFGLYYGKLDPSENRARHAQKMKTYYTSTVKLSPLAVEIVTSFRRQDSICLFVV